MNNDFQEYNERQFESRRTEEQYKRRKTRRFLEIIFALLVVCFFSTYIIVNKINSINTSNEDSKTTLYNNTIALDDDMKIILKVDGVILNEETLKSFKEDRNLSSVNEQFLVDYYTSQGYELESLSDSKVVLNKGDNEDSLEPNKYYLGEKNGYFAIYKTDSDGVPYIENESDIYTNYRPISSIPSADQEEIKNFKHGYNTKEEAKESLSGYIS